jgi:hypothetical protein
MSYTPIPKGTDPWDVQVNTAFADQDSRIDVNTNDIAAVVDVNNQQWNEITINRDAIARVRVDGMMPSDYGLLSWVYDIAVAGAATAPVSGTIYMIKVYINAGTVSALGVNVSTIGSGLVAGQSFLGLYSATGSLLGVTADQSVAFTTTGYKQPTLVTPVVVTSGYYYVAFVTNGATPPAFIRGSNFTAGASLINLNLTPADARFTTAGTGTTLPASITLASRTTIITAFWAAVA